MKPSLWRLVTLVYGVGLLVLAASNSVGGFFFNATPGFSIRQDSVTPGTATVTQISNRAAIDGPIAAGDRVRLTDTSLANRLRFAREKPGERFAFTGTTTAGRKTSFVMTMTPIGPASPAFWSFEAMSVVFVLVGLVIAVRRPADPVARRLVGLLLVLGTVLTSGPGPLMPVWFVAGDLAVQTFCNPFAAFAALALAAEFPRPSTRGVRRWLRLGNPWLLVVCLATLYGSIVPVLVFLRPVPPGFRVAGIIETLLYYLAITVAFVVAGRGVTGADRKRLQWVAWTLAAGFSGSLALVALIILHLTLEPWMAWLNLTLLAIPFGLGYAIVRHRVVDIGFVVNRALVFGTISAIVVIAFGILEWALSSTFVRVSHITSTSLELALALGLGFSLRTIHAKVDHAVDDLFFRDRHAAERALRTFAREVAYVTDPHVAVERAHAELLARTGATAVAVYVADAHSAVRVDPAESAAPDTVGIDDPALVRMRATRAPAALRELETALPGEWAFPMCVRDTVTGMVALGPKANGEAYAPDEVATIETVALALGNALDALQTAALKAEVARVLLDGAPVEALRRTVDAASWARAVPQPAGSLPGLGE